MDTFYNHPNRHKENNNVFSSRKLVGPDRWMEGWMDLQNNIIIEVEVHVEAEPTKPFFSQSMVPTHNYLLQ